MLIGHLLAFMGSSMCQVAFIPITTLTSNLFGMSNVMISMCSLVFSISFIPCNFIAIKILNAQKGGLNVGVRIY